MRGIETYMYMYMYVFSEIRLPKCKRKQNLAQAKRKFASTIFFVGKILIKRYRVSNGFCVKKPTGDLANITRLHVDTHVHVHSLYRNNQANTETRRKKPSRN